VPRLGVNLDLEDTRFSVDFGTDDHQGPEESTSELPWAIPNTGANAREYTRGFHSPISGPIAQ
jgi:hypothetical protein